MHGTNRWTTGAAAGVLLLGLGGCGLLGGSGSGSDGGSGPDAAGPGSAATPAAAVVASASPGATVAPLPAIGTRKTSDGRYQIEVSLNEVHVGAKTMDVTWTVKNATSVDLNKQIEITGSARWQVSDYFDDGIYQELADGTRESGHVADGVYVVDAAAGKRFLVARGASGNCVCPANLAGAFIGAGESMVFSATFGAPPPSTTTVDVSIPHAGTFAKVPVVR